MRRKCSRLLHGSAGFTLLEALVALALTALILGFLSMITHQWLPNWNRGFGYVQGQERLALGIERLISDLSAAEFIPVVRESRLPFFAGTSDSVMLVRTASAPRAYPSLEFVRIVEARVNGRALVVRSRAPFALADANDRDGPTFTDPVILVREPYRLSFSFAGMDRIWRESWERERQLPRAIKITVRDENTGQTLAVSTATLVHTEVPFECITSKSLATCLNSRAQTPHQAGASEDNKVSQTR